LKKKFILVVIMLVGISTIVLFSLIKNGVNQRSVDNTQQFWISQTLETTQTQFNLTKTPTITSTLTPIPSKTVTPTATFLPDYTRIEFLYFDAVYNVSSRFALNMNELSGDYYASGRVNNGALFAYKCDFRTDKTTQLVCESGPLPFDTKVNLQLYLENTDELVFSQQINYNFVSYGEVIASPTGVMCEGEPQWNGAIPAHQLDKGCFAMSCWQNGNYLWGTDNTCRDPWPFLWKYEHPLNLPTP